MNKNIFKKYIILSKYGSKIIRTSDLRGKKNPLVENLQIK
jgi:hypothetical protein